MRSGDFTGEGDGARYLPECYTYVCSVAQPEGREGVKLHPLSNHGDTLPIGNIKYYNVSLLTFNENGKFMSYVLRSVNAGSARAKFRPHGTSCRIKRLILHVEFKNRIHFAI